MIVNRSKYLKTLGSFFIFFTIIFSQYSLAQTQQEAASSIQNAKEKLIDILILLEESSVKKIGVSDLVLKADLARNLIKEASDKYLEGDYELAQQKANTAIQQLDEIIEEITEALDSKTQRSRILFSSLGVLAALLSIGLVFLFIKKIYPWYKIKQLEEYGKLIIIYDEENKVIKNERK
jgi:hypothetical protein